MKNLYVAPFIISVDDFMFHEEYEYSDMEEAIARAEYAIECGCSAEVFDAEGNEVPLFE